MPLHLEMRNSIKRVPIINALKLWLTWKTCWHFALQPFLDSGPHAICSSSEPCPLMAIPSGFSGWWKVFYLDSIPNISNLVTDWGPDLPYSPCVNLLRPWQAPRCFHCENSASRLCSAAILGTRRGYVPACKDYSFGNSNNRIVCPLPFVPVSRLNNHNFNTTCSDLDTFLRGCASCTFRWKYLLISSSTIFHGCLLIIFNWVFPATPLLQRSKSVQIRHVLWNSSHGFWAWTGCLNCLRCLNNYQRVGPTIFRAMLCLQHLQKSQKR